MVLRLILGLKFVLGWLSKLRMACGSGLWLSAVSFLRDFEERWAWSGKIDRSGGQEMGRIMAVEARP